MVPPHADPSCVKGLMTPWLMSKAPFCRHATRSVFWLLSSGSTPHSPRMSLPSLVMARVAVLGFGGRYTTPLVISPYWPSEYLKPPLKAASNVFPCTSFAGITPGPCTPLGPPG